MADEVEDTGDDIQEESPSSEDSSGSSDSAGDSGSTSDSAFVSPEEVEDWDAESNSDDEDEASEGEDEESEESDDSEVQELTEKELNNAIKKLKLEGKDDDEVKRALAKAFWAANNAGAENTKTLKAQKQALEEQLEAAQEKLDSLENPRTATKPEDKAKELSQDATVKRYTERVTSIQAQKTANATTMKEISAQSVKTNEDFVRAQLRFEDASEEDKPSRRRALESAASAHNSLVDRWQALQNRGFEIDERLADLTDRLEEAKSVAEAKLAAEQKSRDAVQKYKTSAGKQFTSLVDSYIKEFNIPKDDRADFFEDIQAGVAHALQKLGPTHPAVDLAKLTQTIVERRFKLEGLRDSNNKNARFSKDSEKKLKSVKSIKPPQRVVQGAPKGKPSQKKQSVADSADAARRHAAKILGG